MGWLFQTKSERQKAATSSNKRSISEYEDRSPTSNITTADKPEGKAVSPDKIKDCFYEKFLIGGERYDYQTLIKKYDVPTLKVLMTSPDITVEIYCSSADDANDERVPAHLELGIYGLIHDRRVSTARNEGTYAIPRVKLSERADKDDALSLDQMAEQLRQAGYTVTPAPAAPQSEAAPEQPPAPADGTPASPAPALAPRSSGPNPALAAGSQG